MTKYKIIYVSMLLVCKSKSTKLDLHNHTYYKNTTNSQLSGQS